MTTPDSDPLFLVLAVPAGSLFGNVPYVEDGGDLYACVPPAEARSELAEAPFVVVTFGNGHPEIPRDRDEAELGTLADTPPRRAKLVAVGGQWMRVDWLPEEPEPPAGLTAACRTSRERRERPRDPLGSRGRSL